MENQVIKKDGKFEFWLLVGTVTIIVAIFLFCLPREIKSQEPIKIEQIEKF